MSTHEESVAIFWDYENCELPASVDGFTVASGISNIAHQYGSVKVFKAYFEMSELNSQRSISVRSDLQSCGVSLIDCPHNGRKDVADKMMLVDMLAHAIDNPAPSTVILISGDRDFVYAVSVLRLRKYRVVVIAPNAAHASLKIQASAVYEWPRHVLPSDISLETSGSTPSAWTTNEPPMAITSGRTGLFTPPDSTRGTPTTNRVLSYFPPVMFHRAHSVGAASTHTRSSTMGHHRSSPSASSILSGSSVESGHSSQSDNVVAPFTTKESPSSGRFWLSSTTTSGSRERGRSCGPLDHIESDPAEEAARRNSPGEPSGANDGSSPVTVGAPLASSQSFPIPSTEPASTTVSSSSLLSRLVPASDAAGAEESQPLLSSPGSLDTLLPAPTVCMTRLRAPPGKFKSLVTVLERERTLGNTRVAFSQLGSMLRAEDPSAYKRAGAKQLRDFAAMAEDEGIVILGTSDWDNGNRWTALHPTYHGKPPEALTQPSVQTPVPLQVHVQAQLQESLVF